MQSLFQSCDSSGTPASAGSAQAHAWASRGSTPWGGVSHGSKIGLGRRVLLVAALLGLHAMVWVVVDAVLSLNRLALRDTQVTSVRLLPMQLPQAAPPSPAATQNPKPQNAKSNPSNALPSLPDTAQADTSTAPEPPTPITPPSDAQATMTPTEPVTGQLPTGVEGAVSSISSVATTTKAISAETSLRPSATTPVPEAAKSDVVESFDPPPSARLRYVVSKGGDTGKGELLWQIREREGQRHYELMQEMTYFGFSAIKQTSTGVLSAQGVQPLRFGDKRFRKSEQAAHMERDKGLVVFSNNRPTVPLPALLQDRLSVFVQLAGWQTKRSAITLPVASVDEVQLWTFEAQGEETLPSPAGAALKYVRKPRREFDQTVEVWLGTKHHHLPVRIRLTDSSGVTDMQLTHIEAL